MVCKNDSFFFFNSNREDQISASRPFYNPNTTSIKAAVGEGCPRCGGKVFAAEQQLAKGTVSFHDDMVPIFSTVKTHAHTHTLRFINYTKYNCTKHICTPIIK